MGSGGVRGAESRREGPEKRKVEAEWEHVECRVSRDHGTKERERREKDLRRYHDQGGEEGASERERRREESKG